MFLQRFFIYAVGFLGLCMLLMLPVSHLNASVPVEKIAKLDKTGSNILNELELFLDSGALSHKITLRTLFKRYERDLALALTENPQQQVLTRWQQTKETIDRLLKQGKLRDATKINEQLNRIDDRFQQSLAILRIDKIAVEAARQKAEAKAAVEAARREAEAKTKQVAVEKARREAEAAEAAARQKAEAKAAVEAARREAEAKAKQVAVEKARREAEAAEAAARQKAKAKSAVEAARREAKAKAKKLAAEKARREAEAKTKQVAVEKARREAEAAEVAVRQKAEDAKAAAHREAAARQKAVDQVAAEKARRVVIEPASATPSDIPVGMIAGAGLAAVLVGIGVMWMRKRKSTEPPETVATAVLASEPPESLTGGMDNNEVDPSAVQPEVQSADLLQQIKRHKKELDVKEKALSDYESSLQKEQRSGGQDRRETQVKTPEAIAEDKRTQTVPRRAADNIKVQKKMIDDIERLSETKVSSDKLPEKVVTTKADGLTNIEKRQRELEAMMAKLKVGGGDK